MSNWTQLSYVLSETIRDIRNPPSPDSSSEEDLDFDDDWEYLPPAGDASHRPVASHRTDHAGRLPSYTPPDSASDPGSPESETTPPPPYSRHSGRRNAGGHREAHERTMHQGSRNTGGPREGYDNTRYQGGGDAGGPRARHGNSHYQEGGYAGGSREGYDNTRYQGGGYAGGSLSAYDYQPSGAFNARSTEAMDRERFPERRRGEWVIDNNSYLDQMPRLNRLLSARRGGG